jgi:hypothetical protein
MCIRGGKVNDISSAILHLPESTNLENIIIQVGSNDCVSDDFNKDTFREEYCALVEIARSVSDTVVISGIPFHVCLTICPSTHLVYATSHLSFVAFYSYLVSWLAMI